MSQKVTRIPAPAGAPRFEPRIAIEPLATRVLAVATTSEDGTWRAYVDAVPGVMHSEEWRAVLDRGKKLSESHARAIFPKFAAAPYAL